MRPTSLALAALLAAAGCRKQAEPAPSPPAPASFRLSDLAAAAALDARLASLTYQSSRYLDLAARGEAAQARETVPVLEAAVQAASIAAGAVIHPLDRPGAEAALGAARRFAAALAAFGQASAADPRASPAALVQARDDLGRAVNAYRQVRSAWKVDQPLEVGAAQDFADAKRDLEKAEMQALEVSLVAPRSEGHKLDGAARLAAQAAAGRARDAAARLEPELRDAAGRWVEAQDRSVQALMALAAGAPPDHPRLSLAYQAARAEALGALATLTRLRADRAAR
ncbi:MAG TPA: hypothetical protein VH880_01020 [Anaeromyxobacteraceae bacterium]|jgi:hypothetical protein